MSSSIGTIFKVTTYGESHGKSIGVIIDGVPAGLHIDMNFIQNELNKRKPTNNNFTTTRIEDDIIDIHSGVFENISTGTPIFINVENKNQKSRDYSNIKDIYRPNHADYTYENKYGIRDYRGGGRSSGRETCARVIAGAIAKLILNQLNIDITAFTTSIGEIKINNNTINKKTLYNNDLRICNDDDYVKCIKYLDSIKKENDSIGGTVKCVIKNVPIGLGQPVFNKLDATLSQALMSIGSVKGIEFGEGFKMSVKKGSVVSDNFYSQNNNVFKHTNFNGGTLGGISDGSNIEINIAIKPTPSIGIMQSTVNKNLENIQFQTTGRHDTIIVPRITSVIEAMCAIMLVDALLVNMTCKIDNIKKIYN